MIDTTARLFDPERANRAIARAERLGPATFLLERLAEDVQDRLGAVLRHFETGLDYGTPYGAFGRAALSAGRASAMRFSSLPAPPPPAENAPPTLPDARLPAQSLNLLLSGLLFQRVDDLPGLMIQFRRALAPDGLMLAAFPGGDTLCELRDVLLAAESDIADRAGLRVMPMIDVRMAGQLLQRAGFALPVADSDRLTLTYPDLFALIRDLRAMGSSGAMLARPGLPPLTRPIVARAAELYHVRHARPDGRLPATIEIIWMSGWAPHASQQQPLKPGSAKARLADALAEMCRRREKD